MATKARGFKLKIGKPAQFALIIGILVIALVIIFSPSGQTAKFTAPSYI